MKITHTVHWNIPLVKFMPLFLIRSYHISFFPNNCMPTPINKNKTICMFICKAESETGISASPRCPQQHGQAERKEPKWQEPKHGSHHPLPRSPITRRPDRKDRGARPSPALQYRMGKQLTPTVASLLYYLTQICVHLEFCQNTYVDNDISIWIVMLKFFKPFKQIFG